MTTYRDLVYMVKDSLKLSSDDSYIENGHIIFQLNNARALLLNQKYTERKFLVPEDNFIEICLELEYVDRIANLPCEGPGFLKTKLKPPHILNIANPRLFSLELFGEDIPLIPMKRMTNLGYHRFLNNIIYASYGPDGYIYLFSSNPQFYNLEKIRMSAVFSDPSYISQFRCDDSGEYIKCNDVLDAPFPLESALHYPLIEIVFKYFASSLGIVPDMQNNAQDDAPIVNRPSSQPSNEQ